ncbi:MAG TPA: hypothetical protein VFF67_01580 [Thermoplasmata archaeon]|nr:hypothetical protein [Thermoplasmata archaeon]
MAGAVLLGSLATGLVAASTTYTITFTETGLPAGTNWSITFNSVSMSSTTSTITFGSISGGTYYYWSATNPVTIKPGIQYGANPTGSYMYVPQQLTQVVVFQKQLQVTFVAAPTSDGFTSPGGSPFFPAGSQIPITAGHYTGYAFQTWVAGPGVATLANANLSSTMATITGTGRITAHFTPIPSRVAFSEVGLPSGKGWSVTFAGSNYISGKSGLTAGAHPPGGYSWSIPAVSGGTGTQYSPTPSSGTMTVPYQTSQTVVFVLQYQVAFATLPAGSGSTTPSATTYYNNGSAVAVAASSTSTTVFSRWSSSNAAIGLASAANESTFATVGGHGTLTAKFVAGTPCSNCTLNFTEFGLPAGTSWGVTFNNLFYGGSTPTISVPGVKSSVSWTVSSPLSSGNALVEYVASPYYGYMYIPGQSSQAIVFTEEAYVTVLTSPNYYASLTVGSGYAAVGSTLAISAINSDSWAFQSWSTNSTALILAHAKSSATTLKVTGPGALVANYVQPSKSLAFEEFNLPKATTWWIDFAGTYYSSSTPWINVTQIPVGSYSWSVPAPIAGASAGMQYASVYTYGGVNVNDVSVQAIVFQKQFLVTFLTSGKSGGSVSPTGSSYYPAGSILPLSADNGTNANFTAWSTSNALLVIGQPSYASTTLKVTGSGNVTAKFT